MNHSLQTSNYDKQPRIAVAGQRVWTGYLEAFSQLARESQQSQTPVIALDTYPGSDLEELREAATAHLPNFALVNVEEAALGTDALEALLSRFLTEDRVFGYMAPHHLSEFYDSQKLTALREQVAAVTQPTLVYGWGASLAVERPTLLVVADLARWEIRQRYRRGMTNWHADNRDEDILRKEKRGFFVEWRVADRHKRELFGRMDYYLDVNTRAQPVMISAQTFHWSLTAAVARPFRVVPFFDPGVWGGQWMKEAFDLDHATPNYAWGFDGVPEENSLLFEYGDTVLEMPALNLVMQKPRELLGSGTYARFGAEFPIRFDFLDTMQGGNLSLQVHPLTSYIQEHFGMHYTQDESYYMLDAGEHAVVYLGLKNGMDREQFLSDLETSQHTGSFEAERYVNALPAKKHDHFSIPAGTIHCSGRDCMVLEISATPYIFTFKLWDWSRVGLDGHPRPIHFEHGKTNIQWERNTDWVQENLLDAVCLVESGEGWREERTGLHELEFIETRRHWFSVPVQHDTRGTVNVLNLVEGKEAVVESPTGAFEPFRVHYAETFIIPAAVGPYTVRPAQPGVEIGTLKAYVRGTTSS